MFHAHAKRSRGMRPKGRPQHVQLPARTLPQAPVQQLRLPFNRAEAGNSRSYAIEHDIPGGYDCSSLLDTPAGNDSTVIIHAHQMRVPNSHNHEVGGRRNPHTTGQALRTVAATVGRPRPAAARYSMPRARFL